MSETDQGLLIGAYFPGYVACHIIGGSIAFKFGVKKVLLYTFIPSSILTIMFPLLIRTNFYLAVVSRVILGSLFLMMITKKIYTLLIICLNWYISVRTKFISKNKTSDHDFSIWFPGYKFFWKSDFRSHTVTPPVVESSLVAMVHSLWTASEKIIKNELFKICVRSLPYL